MVIVDLKKCVGCGTCQIVCPLEAIYAWTQARLDRTRCTDCYVCVESCPQEALNVEPENKKMQDVRLDETHQR
jgi:NAD-dependent dihydropyrimidine dehydrogenase PreA subunit